MRRILLLLACCGVILGQPSVQFNKLLSNVSMTGPSGVATNVGQIGHSAYLFFTNAPSHTCSSPNATAQLEYSFDNSIWTAFGSPQSATTVMSGQAYIGQGAFAYIRFNLVSFDTTNCLATVWYAGTSQPLAIQLNGPIGSTASLVVCDKASASSFSQGSTFPIVLVAKPSSGAIHVCSISIQVSGTTTGEVGYGTSGGTACQGSSISGSGTDLIPLGSFALGVNTFGAGSLGQTFLVPAGNQICFGYNGTNTGVTYNVTVAYTVF